MRIYSAFFTSDGKHCTWEFNPGKCSLPPWCEEGDIIPLVKIGEYRDQDVRCDIVEIRLGDITIRTQESGTLLHITTWCRDGVKPIESGLRATRNGYTPTDEVVIPAKAGYFTVKG